MRLDLFWEKVNFEKVTSLPFAFSQRGQLTSSRKTNFYALASWSSALKPNELGSLNKSRMIGIVCWADPSASNHVELYLSLPHRGSPTHSLTLPSNEHRSLSPDYARARNGPTYAQRCGRTRRRCSGLSGGSILMLHSFVTQTSDSNIAIMAAGKRARDRAKS